MAISCHTAPGTKVLRNQIERTIEHLPDLTPGQTYTVAEMCDCTFDCGDYGVKLEETLNYHEPVLDAHLFGTHAGFMVFCYDLDLFDLPSLPECLTRLTTPVNTPELV